MRNQIAVMMLLLLMIMQLLLPASAQQVGLTPEKHTAPGGAVYTVYPQGDYALGFVTTRPSTSDSNIVFSCAAAFTTTTDRVVGIYVSDGTVGNRNNISKGIGGAAIIENGKARLMATTKVATKKGATNKAALLTPDLISRVETSKGSLFQQFLLIANGKPTTFKDKGKSRRRALVEFNNGKWGVVESNRPITINSLNEELASLGAKAALYLDMGGWDEGWYRDATTGKPITIGYERTDTKRQTNWLVYRKR